MQDNKPLAEFLSLIGGMQGGYSWDNAARLRYLSVCRHWRPRLLKAVAERVMAQAKTYRPSPEQLLVMAAETVYPCLSMQETANELRRLVEEYGLCGMKAEGFHSFRKAGCPPIESRFLRRVVEALGGWESVVALIGNNYDQSKKIEAVYVPLKEQWNKSAIRRLNERITEKEGAAA